MKRLYFIIGCTAAGKGSVGRELARRLGARIVSVDSMKVYKRMDIGTNKPSAQIRRQTPHYCVDVVEPSESFSVAQFVSHADAAVEEIASAGAVALAVGGTSLYIKALSEGLFEAPAGEDSIRANLLAQARLGELAAMHERLSKVDPAAARKIHPNDERRIVRALEVYETTGVPISSLQQQWDTGQRRYDAVFIGLRRQKEDQSRRINLRVKMMIEAGLRDEVAALLDEPTGLSSQASQAVGYAEMIEHLRGGCSLEDAIEKIKINTRRLAKKQRTWHRRFEGVTWFDVNADETPDHVCERIMAEVFPDLEKVTDGR
jgi:tRNA dimethylallyltransferase